MSPLPRDMLGWETIPSASSDSPAGQGQSRPVIVSLQYYLPEVFPIPGAQEFDLFDVSTSPGAGTTIPAGLRFVMPQSSVGIVRVITAGVDDMTNATRLFFRMVLDGGRVLGPAGNFSLFPGVAARATASADVFVRLPSGATVDVQIVNVDGAAYQVGFGYSGWWWPEALGAAWTQGR
jgi:hypothetical protein